MVKEQHLEVYSFCILGVVVVLVALEAVLKPKETWAVEVPVVKGHVVVVGSTQNSSHLLVVVAEGDSSSAATNVHYIIHCNPKGSMKCKANSTYMYNHL